MSDDLDTAESAAMTRILVGVIAAVFEKQHPAVIGATLADLVSMWLAGHSPNIREEALQMHITNVRHLLPINLKKIVEMHDLDEAEWTGCGTSKDETRGEDP